MNHMTDFVFVGLYIFVTNKKQLKEPTIRNNKLINNKIKKFNKSKVILGVEREW